MQNEDERIASELLRVEQYGLSQTATINANTATTQANSARDAALEAGAEIREVVFHQFAPHGVSGVVIISESHLTIHSFPEHGYASIDVYTCGDKVDPNVAVEYIAKSLESKISEKMEIPRGMGPVKAQPFQKLL